MTSRSLLMGLSVVLIAGLWFGIAATTAAQQGGKGDILKVGKRGEVYFTSRTKVGDLVLEPGEYVLQHRVLGSEHFVRFTEYKRVQEVHPEASETTVPLYPGEVKCRVERLPKTASRTVVTTVKEGDLVRVVRVEIKGENVAHVL